MTTKGNVLLSVLFLISYTLFSQYLDLESGQNITGYHGDEINTVWSPDGNRIAFESIVNGKSSIYIYDVNFDTIFQITHKDANFRNPVWHPNGNKLVIDSDINGNDYLYYVDIPTFQVTPLFSRNIICKDPSYSTSDRQIYFTGYNDIENKWEVYSYDFIYDNLNEVSDKRFNCALPEISPNGKLILYSVENPFSNSSDISIMNWYGEETSNLKNIKTDDFVWHPAGLKFLFISKDENLRQQLFSIWKDGTHIEQITNSEVIMASPAISPDGMKLALSIKMEAGYDIIILNFEDY